MARPTLVTTFGAATQRSAWLLDVPVTPRSGPATLSDLGVQLLVLPFESYRRLDGSLGEFDRRHAPAQHDAPRPDSDGGRRRRSGDADPRPATTTATRHRSTKAIHLMAEIATVQSQLEPDRRSLVVTTPDLGVPDPEVMRSSSSSPLSIPTCSSSRSQRSPDSPTRLFVDGQAVTVDLDDEPPVDLSARARAVDAPASASPTSPTMLPVRRPAPSRWDDGPANGAHDRHGDPAADRLDRRCRARHRPFARFGRAARAVLVHGRRA